MSKSTLFSVEDIIETGKSLEIEKPGRDVTPWQIHKKLGNRGNFERVRVIWEKHVEDRKGQPDEEFEADCIPVKFRESLDKLFGDFGTGIDMLFAQYDAHLSGQFNRQNRVVQDAHDTEIIEQKEETAYWRKRALEAERLFEEKAGKQQVGAKAKPSRQRGTPKDEPEPTDEPLPGQMRLAV